MKWGVGVGEPLRWSTSNRNRYDATITIVPVGAAPKVRELELLEEKKLP